ncbi:cysteine hydrolase family protein [Aliiroseovarius crassostreae]|uniref:cysteine hydrolase family protein n=1 Tax=Aliiroseovarius crassostreae TaxID=154981 RepID=UPI003C7A1436
MTLLWTGLFLLAAFLLWASLTYRHIGSVSTGKRIGDRPGSALLLIDLQQDFWDSGQYDEAEKARATGAIHTAISEVKTLNRPVVVIRQEWSTPSTRLFARLFMKGQGIAGRPGTQLADPFTGIGDHEVVKRVQDAFETGALDQLLARLDVGHLHIAGLDAAFCVNKTAQAALARGYQVTVIADGVLGALPKASAKARKHLEQLGARFI